MPGGKVWEDFLNPAPSTFQFIIQTSGMSVSLIAPWFFEVGITIHFTAEEIMAQKGDITVQGQYGKYGTGLLTSYLVLFLQPALGHQSQVRWANDPGFAPSSETRWHREEIACPKASRVSPT